MKKRARRNHSPALKARVALAAIKGDRTHAQLSEQFDVHVNQITIWKDQSFSKVPRKSSSVRPVGSRLRRRWTSRHCTQKSAS